MSQQLLVDLFDAYYEARRHKRRSVSAAQFEVDFEKKLFCLYEEIIDRSYTISPSTCFVVQRPVQREVFAADFRDRIVHHLLYGYLNPLCERIFIYDSYRCRKGKGAALGKKRLDHFIRSCSQNYTNECYILKVDILGYFMNMNRDILYEKIMYILKRYYERGDAFGVEVVQWLLQLIVFNDPVADCIMKGGVQDWHGLPKTKSLFHAKDNTGFPIGNLTSQLFANVYLHDFDCYMKYKLGCRYYGRYVDDIVIVHQDRDFLKRVVLDIRSYLSRELGLLVHPHKIYLQPYSHGVCFLGEVFKPGRRYVGLRTRRSIYRYIYRWNTVINVQSGVLQMHQVQDFLLGINSYLGSVKYIQSYRFRIKMLQTLQPKFWQYVGINTRYDCLYMK